MRNKVTSVTIKVPQDVTLPDGLYSGVWGGYVIEVKHDGKEYQLHTEEGVRGIGIKVVVEVKDGVVTFDELKS